MFYKVLKVLRRLLCHRSLQLQGIHRSEQARLLPIELHELQAGCFAGDGSEPIGIGHLEAMDADWMSEPLLGIKCVKI